MKAAFLTDIRKVEVRQAPVPQLQGPRDVLLRVDVVGVCGSDMHYYRTGRIGDQVVTFPWLVGHECSATVVEVGDEVTRVSEGELVAVDPLVWCQECDQCLAGRVHTCRRQGFLGCPGQLPGCLCEYIVMPEESCFPVPVGMTAEQAAIVEPLSIGLYAQRLAAEDMTGMRVGILGSGPIGLCVLASCQAAGAEAAWMTDIRENRVALAREMGADWAGNPDSQDVVAEIRKQAEGGLDYVFECAGEQATVDQAVDLCRPGGKVLLVGIPEVDRISFRMDTVRRNEITLQPVRRQNHCVPGAIDLLFSGRADLEPMVTHRYGIDETQTAFDVVADYQDGAVKAMISVP